MTRRSPAVAWVAYAGTIGFLLVFLVLPVLLVIGVGLRPGLLIEALSHPLHRQGLLNAFAIGVVTTLLSLAIALPLAWLRGRYRFRGEGLADALLLSPLILPPFVGALGIAQIFGHYGAFNALLISCGLLDPAEAGDWLASHRFALVCLLEALHLYPICYLYLRSAVGHVDPSLIQAARGLGAGRLSCWWRIILPLLRPALFAGGSIVFIWSFTELGTPLLLGYHRVTPVQVFHGLSSLQSNQQPFALVVVMLAVVAVIYALSRRLVLRDEGKGIGGRLSGTSTERSPVTGPALLALWLFILSVAGLAAMPHASVALIALGGDWYATVWPTSLTTAHLQEALSHPLVVPSIGNSLSYAAWATLLAGVLGCFIAWCGQRWRPPGWRAVDLLAMLPLAIPGLIIAFGYLALIGLLDMTPGFAWAHALLDPISNPTLLLIIAYAVRRMPYMLRAAAAGLSQIPPAYEEAAASLGADALTRWRRILLPLLRGSLIAGALLTFSFCMLEVADSLILAQKQVYYPITKVIYELTGLLGSGPTVASAFALWAMLFLGLSLALVVSLLGGKIGEVFRRG